MTTPSQPPDQSLLYIPRGATWAVYWPVFDPDGSGQPLDISTWSAVGQIRKWYGAADTLFEWSATNDNIECSADGKVTIRVSPADSTAWEFDSAVYGVELVSPTGDRYPLAIGGLIVAPEVVV